jgi:hypothetical protein
MCRCRNGRWRRGWRRCSTRTRSGSRGRSGSARSSATRRTTPCCCRCTEADLDGWSPFDTMHVGDYLRSIPKVGPVKVTTALRRMEISRAKTLGGPDGPPARGGPRVRGAVHAARAPGGRRPARHGLMAVCFCGCGQRGVQKHHAIYEQHLRPLTRPEARRTLLRDARNLVPSLGTATPRIISAAGRSRWRRCPTRSTSSRRRSLGVGPAYEYLRRRYAGPDARLDGLLVRCDGG